MRPILPKVVTFVDVETTGLATWDRVITLGAIRLDTEQLDDGYLNIQTAHLVFDPRKDCHPEASAIHGYDDWSLRHQDLFADHASQLWGLLNEGEIIVAHNASFDERFLAREFRKADCQPMARPMYCTMEAYYGAGLPGSAALDAVCRRAGFGRAGQRHGALEDAWLAMLIYLWLHGRRTDFEMPAAFAGRPKNWIEPPPRPEGELPRRSRKVPLARAA